MFIPREIKTAARDLADFIAERGLHNAPAYHEEAHLILQRIWEVREQMPEPQSVCESYTTATIAGSHDVHVSHTEEEVIYAEKLIGHALDIRMKRRAAWDPKISQDDGTSWIGELATSVIEHAGLTSKNFDGPKRRINELRLDLPHGRHAFEQAVEDLAVEQKQKLANLTKHRNMRSEVFAGIRGSLGIDIIDYSPEEYIDLGAMTGLFYAVWLKAKRM